MPKNELKELVAYTAKANKLEAFKIENEVVFSRFEQLRTELDQAEINLKVKVKELGEDVSNKFFVARFSQKFSKGYNFEKLYSLANDKEKQLIDDITDVIKKVDSIKLKSLIEAEMIRTEIAQQAFEEKELAPAVSIKKLE